MGNIMHHRVMVLMTYLVMAMSAHECLTSEEKQVTSSSLNGTTGVAEGNSSWPAALGALTAVLSIGLLIALAVRYRFFRWCRMAGNRHALLLDEETPSQINQAGALEGEIPVRGMRGRMRHTGESSDDEDDDGFIEDNYIQASVREIEEEEENQLEDAEDSDDELIMPEII
ncbi:hypothetical protein PO909_030543 [Leuciscus waleckii]